MPKIIKKDLSNMPAREIVAVESFLDKNFSTVFHEPAFNRTLTKCMGTDFRYYLVYNDLDELLALCPVHSTRNGIATTAFSNPPKYEAFYGGWVYDSKNISLDELMESFRLSFFESLVYWSMPQILDDGYKDMEGARVWETPVIDLALSEEEIWKGTINQKRRNMVRKAKKNDVMVEAGLENYDAFYSLMEETYSNAGIPLKPREYYRDILREYEEKGDGLLLLASIDSKPVSGIIVLRNRHICNYWIGSSTRKAKNMGQGELLHWEAIQWAKKKGSRYYDLSIVMPEKLPHIARFKLGLSKNTVPFYSVGKRSLGYRILSRLRMLS